MENPGNNSYPFPTTISLILWSILSAFAKTNICLHFIFSSSFSSAFLFIYIFLYLFLIRLEEIGCSPLHGNAVSHSCTHCRCRSSHNSALPCALSLRPLPICALPLPSPSLSLSLLVSLSLTHMHTHIHSTSPLVHWSPANAAPSTDCEMFSPACKGSAGEPR